MTRQIQITGSGTPFGFWMRKNCRDSRQGLSVTDVDYVLYVIEDFRNRSNRKYMFLDEKGYKGKLDYGQTVTFQVMDCCFRIGAKSLGYDYWGFYLLQFDGKSTNDSSHAYLNGRAISSAELIRHINFEEKAIEGLDGNYPDVWMQFMKYGKLAALPKPSIELPMKPRKRTKQSDARQMTLF